MYTCVVLDMVFPDMLLPNVHLLVALDVPERMLSRIYAEFTT